MAFKKKLEALDAPVRFLRFEDIVLFPQQVVASLGTVLEGVRDQFVDLKESTKSGRMSLQDHQAYHKAENWRSEMIGLTKKVNSMVNWESLHQFGYHPVNPGEVAVTGTDFSNVITGSA